MKSSIWLSTALSIGLALINLTQAYDFGVCYGMVGDNLPPASDVVAFYQKMNFNSMRLFDPNPAALEALRHSPINVLLGVRNEDIPQIASSQEGANQWFSDHVAPYIDDVVIPYISVGNEVIPGEFAAQVLPAMQNLQSVLDGMQLTGIRISTVAAAVVLGTSYPPSAGEFSAEANAVLPDILKFLSAQGSPLMVNVYPYFAYASDPTNIRLDYAQFTAPGPVVQDGDLNYQNLFDATLDAFYSAMEKAGVTDVDLVVTESGWPSAGNGDFTTPELAATYNKNYIQHINQGGTPKRPGSHIEGFVFALFNEDLKPAGVEQNWGLVYANFTPVYKI